MIEYSHTCEKDNVEEWYDKYPLTHVWGLHKEEGLWQMSSQICLRDHMGREMGESFHTCKISHEE